MSDPLPDDAPPPLPRPTKTLLLHTSLLGELRVPDSPDQANELQV